MKGRGACGTFATASKDRLPALIPVSTSWGKCSCGADFLQGVGPKPKKWCSEACRVRSHRDRQRANDPSFGRRRFTPESKGCLTCGAGFVTKRGGAHRIYCSQKCSQVVSSANRSYRERALTPQDQAVRIRRIEVVKRYGSDCCVCRSPVDISLKWPDRMSPSIEHLQPLALGGANSYENVRIAHLRCNTARGIKNAAVVPVSKLHLIGRVKGARIRPTSRCLCCAAEMPEKRAAGYKSPPKFCSRRCSGLGAMVELHRKVAA